MSEPLIRIHRLVSITILVILVCLVIPVILASLGKNFSLVRIVWLYRLSILARPIDLVILIDVDNR